VRIIKWIRHYPISLETVIDRLREFRTSRKGAAENFILTGHERLLIIMQPGGQCLSLTPPALGPSNAIHILTLFAYDAHKHDPPIYIPTAARR
jgi:hypothetical protein